MLMFNVLKHCTEKHHAYGTKLVLFLLHCFLQNCFRWRLSFHIVYDRRLILVPTWYA